MVDLPFMVDLAVSVFLSTFISLFAFLAFEQAVMIHPYDREPLAILVWSGLAATLTCLLIALWV